VICCIDGCENCEDDEQFEIATRNYISAIHSLESRIDALQQSLYSIQFINLIGSPYFYAGYRFTPNRVYNTDKDNNVNNIDNESITPSTDNSFSENNSSTVEEDSTEKDTDNNTNLDDNEVKEVEQSTTEDINIRY
jgi:hypothetical protein